jgi:multidrug efflux pump subunit AcrA (membrane-fusion protein)
VPDGGYVATPQLPSDGESMATIDFRQSPRGRPGGWSVGASTFIVIAAMALESCSSTAPPPPPMTNVAVGTPIARDIVDWDDYVGRFEAVQDVEVRPRISGTVMSVLFR